MKLSKEFLLAIVAILVIIFIFIYRNKVSNDLRENGVLVTVKIEAKLIPARGNGSFSFECSFTYNGEKKLLISPASIKENGSRYLYRYWPALYSPKTDNLQVLLRSEDFEKYNVPLTDSLIKVINSVN